MPASSDQQYDTQKDDAVIPDSTSRTAASIEKPKIQKRASLRALPSTSYDNPYYGYPALQEEGIKIGPKSIKLQHSRKRKRDLLRTLSWLFFMTWRNRITQLTYKIWSQVRFTGLKHPLTICILGIMIALYSRSVKFRDLIRRYHY
jgi:hypothetical protein